MPPNTPLEPYRDSLLGVPWRNTEGRALQLDNAGWSFAEIAERSAHWAEWLRRQGFRAGQVMLCPTTPVVDAILMQHAVNRLGGAFFPVPRDLPTARRAALIRRSGAEWLWAPADDRRDDQRGPKPDQRSGPPCSGSGSLLRTASPRCAEPIEPEVRSPAVLVETSGSSADPKIAMLSATNVAASCTRVNARLELRAGDSWLCVLPRHHVGGLAIGYRCAVAGATLCVLERFDALAVHRALHEHAITHISLVPAMLQRMLEADLAPPAQLRVGLLGGQRLEQSLARRGVEAGWPLYIGYGMTETFSQIAGAWIDRAGSTIGGLEPLDGVQCEGPRCGEVETARANPGAKERLAGSATAGGGAEPNKAPSSSPRPAAHSGASAESISPLKVRGPMLMLGYANPARTPGLGLEHGWLETDDLACRTPDGSVTILGRSDDVIIVAGINVQPADVEEQLSALDGVGQIAVVGIPDAAWGHRLVMLYTGARAPGSIAQWARSALPSQQRPRGFLRLPELPTLASGKRDRRALARLAAAAAAADVPIA